MAFVTCHSLSHPAYCDAVATEASLFRSVLEGVDPSTPVPTCPDWTLADLVDHLGTVHRWAGAMVEVLSPERIPSAQITMSKPGEYAGRPDWLIDGAERLLRFLRAGNPDASMWAWGADKRLGFWSRRMLHETTIHRVDAELAAGLEPSIEPRVAVDGIDEFLENLPFATWAPGATLTGDGETISLRAPDTSWTITLEQEGVRWDHSSAAGDVTATGEAADLYLFTWGRIRAGDGRLAVTGDGALLDEWTKQTSL